MAPCGCCHAPYPSLTGLTNLRSLALPEWTDIASLTALTALACHVEPGCVRRLAPLSNLEVLELTLSDIVLGDRKHEITVDIGKVLLESTRRLVKLHAITVHGMIGGDFGSTFGFNKDTLSNVAASPSLKTLRLLNECCVPFAKVQLLSRQPSGLRRLVVACKEGDEGKVLRLVASVREQRPLLEIEVAPVRVFYERTLSDVWCPAVLALSRPVAQNDLGRPIFAEDEEAEYMGFS
jgi:hypothetical protein